MPGWPDLLNRSQPDRERERTDGLPEPGGPPLATRSEGGGEVTFSITLLKRARRGSTHAGDELASISLLIKGRSSYHREDLLSAKAAADAPDNDAAECRCGLSTTSTRTTVGTVGAGPSSRQRLQTGPRTTPGSGSSCGSVRSAHRPPAGTTRHATDCSVHTRSLRVGGFFLTSPLFRSWAKNVQTMALDQQTLRPAHAGAAMNLGRPHSSEGLMQRLGRLDRYAGRLSSFPPGLALSLGPGVWVAHLPSNGKLCIFPCAVLTTDPHRGPPAEIARASQKA